MTKEPDKNGSDQFLKTVQQVVARNYPSVSGIEFAKGDLDGDGIDDFATIIYFSQDASNLTDIAVYKGDKEDRYSMIARSQPFESHDRRTDNIWIKKGSLFFSVGGSSYAEFWGESYQFRWQSNKFILVGQESSRGKIGGECDERTSVNYLTQKVVEFSCLGKKQKINRHSLKKSKQIFLDEFSL